MNTPNQVYKKGRDKAEIMVTEGEQEKLHGDGWGMK